MGGYGADRATAGLVPAGSAVTIHLDTSFLILAILRGSTEDRRLRALIRDRVELSMSAICWAEFCCGPVDESTLDVAVRLVGEPVPFLARYARTAAALFDQCGRRRGSLVDCMIAAIAVETDATIATGNAADFSRFAPAGLRVLSAE
jgi:predicted nucleic acid-binding protein